MKRKTREKLEQIEDILCEKIEEVTKSILFTDFCGIQLDRAKVIEHLCNSLRRVHEMEEDYFD